MRHFDTIVRGCDVEMRTDHLNNTFNSTGGANLRVTRQMVEDDQECGESFMPTYKVKGAHFHQVSTCPSVCTSEPFCRAQVQKIEEAIFCGEVCHRTLGDTPYVTPFAGPKFDSRGPLI